LECARGLDVVGRTGECSEMHLLRRLLGLPYKTGYYLDHPNVSMERGDGTFAMVDGNLTFTPGKGELMEEVAAGKVTPINGDSRRFAEFEGLDVRPKFQGGVVHRAERDIHKATFAAEGDEGALSVSLAEDVWYLLTEDLSMWAVLRLEIALEVLVIVGFAILLTLASLAEAGGPDVGDIFRGKMLLSLTSVRLSTDSIFGWQSKSASSGLEVAILAVQGWVHWLLLSLAGAVIVARALRPLQQVVFNPDCILTDDEVALRLQIIRPGKVELVNVHINLQVFVNGGRCHQLPLTNGISGYAAWFGTAPMNIRHVIDENSPLRADYPGGKLGIYFIRVSLSATDSNGNPVSAFASYYHPDSFFMGMRDFREAFAARKVMPPRILQGVRWSDQMRRIRDKSTNKGTEGVGLPTWLVNIDNTEAFEPILPPV